MQAMDKNDAIRISKNYIYKLRNSQIGISEAWLFGSYARDNNHIDSDIDIAIVLADNEIHNFDTDVKLMTLRKGEETMIEPHAFSRDEFDAGIPIVNQIINGGVRLE